MPSKIFCLISLRVSKATCASDPDAMPKKSAKDFVKAPKIPPDFCPLTTSSNLEISLFNCSSSVLSIKPSVLPNSSRKAKRAAPAETIDVVITVKGFLAKTANKPLNAPNSNGIVVTVKRVNAGIRNAVKLLAIVLIEFAIAMLIGTSLDPSPKKIVN